jgi:hypothetical protein
LGLKVPIEMIWHEWLQYRYEIGEHAFANNKTVRGNVCIDECLLARFQDHLFGFRTSTHRRHAETQKSRELPNTLHFPNASVTRGG